MLGLGLIGGSIMRAAKAAGREVFGYNRSVEGAHLATADGFDASIDLTATLTRAADAGALIVLAVPMPALANMLAHIGELAPACPLTDVTSVKSAVLEEVAAAGLLERFVGGHPMTGTADSGWAAGYAGLFTRTPWVVSVDDHVDPTVWSMVMTLALDCGAMVVPGEIRRARRGGRGHLAPAAPARRGAWPSPPERCRWPSRWPRARSATGRGWRPPPRTWSGRCARPTRVSSWGPSTGPSICSATPASRWPFITPVADLVEAGHAARIRYDSFPRAEIFHVVIGEQNWREELAAAGRAGGVIRSALPTRGSRR